MKFSEALKLYLDQRDVLARATGATEEDIAEKMLEYYAEQLDDLVELQS